MSKFVIFICVAVLVITVVTAQSGTSTKPCKTGGRICSSDNECCVGLICNPWAGRCTKPKTTTSAPTSTSTRPTVPSTASVPTAVPTESAPPASSTASIPTAAPTESAPPATSTASIPTAAPTESVPTEPSTESSNELGTTADVNSVEQEGSEEFRY